MGGGWFDQQGDSRLFPNCGCSWQPGGSEGWSVQVTSCCLVTLLQNTFYTFSFIGHKLLSNLTFFPTANLGGINHTWFLANCTVTLLWASSQDVMVTFIGKITLQLVKKQKSRWDHLMIWYDTVSVIENRECTLTLSEFKQLVLGDLLVKSDQVWTLAVPLGSWCWWRGGRGGAQWQQAGSPERGRCSLSFTCSEVINFFLCGFRIRWKYRWRLSSSPQWSSGRRRNIILSQTWKTQAQVISIQRSLSMQRTHFSILTGLLYTSHDVDVSEVLQPVVCVYWVMRDAHLIVVCED